MARKRRVPSRTQSRDPLDVLRKVQTALEDREGAVCLAAKTIGDYKEGAICGNKAEARRHTISNAAHLSQIAESGLVLNTLPIDALHIAHYTISDSRAVRTNLPQIVHLPPKPTSIDDASTWHFACGEHDARFKPIDEGILFPSSHEYMRITTEGATGATKALEEILFLMAYRSILSSLSILRGVCVALRKLQLEKGNHQVIRQQASEAFRSYSALMKYKSPYDRRFANIQCYNMTHHLIAGQPHTRLAMSGVDPYATTNILPDGDVSRIVVSHAADETKGREHEIVNRLANMPKELANQSDKGPFINLVANTFGTYISAADYREWSEEDKNALMRAAAKSVTQFL